MPLTMMPVPKRRKTDPPPSRRTVPSPTSKNAADAAPGTSLMVHPQVRGADPRIQQAKNFAVAQAQQDGCTGNFRIFDSQFENYLVPVIPTRSELTG